MRRNYRDGVPLSYHAMDSSEPSEKNWTSSNSNIPCTRLCATCPPSPLSQVLILAKAGRGPSPSVKVGCQLGTVREDEATSMPPQVAGRGPLTDSRIVIPPDGRGGVFVGKSLETLSVWSNTRCFFLGRPDGGEKGEEYGPGLEVVGVELMIGVVLFALGYFWFGCLNLTFISFNENMLPATSRNALGWFVSNWGKVLHDSITKAKVPGFTSSQ